MVRINSDVLRREISVNGEVRKWPKMALDVFTLLSPLKRAIHQVKPRAPRSLATKRPTTMSVT